MIDLAWTGNHFLDEENMRHLVREASISVSLTRRGSPDAAALREALAAHLKVPRDWVWIGAGSSQVLDAVVRYFADREVLDVVPNFPGVETAARAYRIPYRAIRLRAPEPLLPGVTWAAGARPILVTVASPQNPFGSCWPLDQIEALLQMPDAVVVVDEAYVDFADYDVSGLFYKHDNLVVVRTFSKAWGLANLRVGYAVSPLLTARFHADFLLQYSIGELAERVALSLVQQPDLIIHSVQAARSARTALVGMLAKLNRYHSRHSDANFICTEHPEASILAHRLEEQGIRVATLRNLPGYDSAWPDGMRISVAPSAIQDRLIEALASSTEHNQGGGR